MTVDPEALKLKLGVLSARAAGRQRAADTLRRRLLFGALLVLAAGLSGGLLWLVRSAAETPFSDGRRWLPEAEPAARRVPAALR